MELNIAEMRAKAAEQEAAREEAIKKWFEAYRERESNEQEKFQALLNRAGKKAAEETRAAMEAEIETAIENAKAEIKAEYAQKHGVAECDSQREPIKKILGGLFGGKK